MMGAKRYFVSQIPLIFIGLVMTGLTIYATHDVSGRAGTVLMSAGVTCGVLVAVLPILIAASIFLDEREYKRGGSK